MQRQEISAAPNAASSAGGDVPHAGAKPRPKPATPLWHYLRPFIVAGVFALAIWLLHHELGGYNYNDVRSHLLSLSRYQLALAIGLTAASYLLLTLYDWLAVLYVGGDVGYPKVALTSFLAYVMSHNIGLSILGSSAPRYRLYGGSGLSIADITRIIAFASVTFWLGWLTVAGVALIIEPGVAAKLIGTRYAPLLGGVFLALVVGYVVWTALVRAPLQIWQWQVELPRPRIAIAQVVVSAIDWLLASSVLYVLLPANAGVPYSKVVTIFLGAMIAGLVSHIPGGLGVFETVTVKALAPWVPADSVLGSLVAYRAVYYLLPLLVAAVLFAVHEVAERSHHFAAVGGLFDRWIAGIIPRVSAISTFIGGSILLASGSTPADDSRMEWIQELIPLPLVEVSHFVGSLSGLALILLANGLYRRLDAAYHLAVVFFATGIVVSLAKGFDYEEALVLTVMLGALVACRKRFDRRASLLEEPLSGGWVAAVVLVVGGSIWLGFFAYKHVEYAHELWWQFAFEGHAPRFLRASVGVVAAGVAVGLGWLLRPHRIAVEPAVADEGERVRRIVAAAPQAAAHLALLGDKRFLFSDDGDGFIMYGIEGRSWIAMGDPICPEAQRTELIWRFRELCDQYDAWPVFYEAGVANLPTFLDVGLTPLKFGEQARVSLEQFSLEGPARKPMRYVLSRMEREGGSFEVLPAAQVAPLLPRLRVISDEWLKAKETREKGFSLGSFDPEYLVQCPLAIVRHGGEIVAFANLWCSGEQEEVSPDLMRYSVGAPDSAMEYLFIELIKWSQERGYRWFNLGMAPLSGLEDRALAPLWHRLGSFTFRHGEALYNFRGLRQYKDKFDPQWEPRYLVSPGGFALPRVLINVAALVSRGLGGVVAK